MKRIMMVCLVMALSGCDRGVQTEQDTLRPVNVYDVSNSLKKGVRTFPARVVAGDKTDLSFKVPGTLNRVEVLEGERVTSGQLIASLNNYDVLHRLSDRQASYNLAQKQFNRFSQLRARDVVSKADFDVQRAARDSALAALNLVKQELQDMQLRAPFAGIISNVSVSNYQVISPGQTIVTLNSLDTLDVVFNVPESLFKLINEQNKAYQPTVTINNLPGKEFIAQYKEHRANASANSLTYQVTLTMPRPKDFPLLSGMSGVVRINLDNIPSAANRVSVVVPVDAVFSPDGNICGKTCVWVVQEKEGKYFVEARNVTLGGYTSEGVQVLSGLSDGERIVATGANELKENQQVRIWVRERGL